MSERTERRWRRGTPSVLTARAVATGITALFISVGLTSGLDEGSAEVLMLFALFALAAACVLVAWWQAGLGVLTLTAAGAALAVFFIVVGEHNAPVLAIIFGAPYLLSALLLWFGSASLARR